MRILIADDTLANLEAAKEAVKGFSEHEFVFTSSASDALSLIESVDAVITDLIFPAEECSAELTHAYAKYVRRMKVDKYSLLGKKLIFGYYRGDVKMYERKLKETIEFVKNGNVCAAVENVRDLYTDEPEKFARFTHLIGQLSLRKEFPYGGAIMLQAKLAKKRFCLVTSVHSHSCFGADEMTDISVALNGVLLMLPLIKAKVMSFHEATRDGRTEEYPSDDLSEIHRNTYMGESLINDCGGEDEGKASPSVWAEAIRKVLAQ